MAMQGMDFFLEDPSRMDSLTADQILALGRGEEIDFGDTAQAESGKSPAPAGEDEAAVAAAAEEAAAKAAEAKPDTEQKPVVQAKDGVHTIPYAELEAAREKAAQWEAFANKQQQFIDSLNKAKVEDAAAGKGVTEAQEAVQAEYAGEFPEVFNDLKPTLEAMVDAKVNANMQKFAAQLQAQIAPIQQQARDSAEDAHFATIEAAIDDFDALVESGKVQDWIKSQPSFMQPAMNGVLEKGTASEVIDLFTAYKRSEGIVADQTKPALTSQQVKDKAKEVVSKAQGKTPKSLSDVPSGAIHPVDEFADEVNMTASQLLEKFQGMPPDKILKHAARSI